MDEAAVAVRPRTSTRIINRERKKECTSKKVRAEIGRLDADAWTRRAKFLREVFLDHDKRHTYDWTALEKKILALDWFHNPGEYKGWKPGETEDMYTSLFTNLIFNYSHLSMVNMGTTVIACRLLNEFVNIGDNYQIVCMIIRSQASGQASKDVLRVGLIWRGGQTTESFGRKQAIIYSTPQSDDFQCFCDGIEFNIFSKLSDEFDIGIPCRTCDNRSVKLRTKLCLPDVSFETHVVALEITSAIVDGRRNYLAVVKTVDGVVHLIDIVRVIQVTLQVVHRWNLVHREFLKLCREKKSDDDVEKDVEVAEINHEGITYIDANEIHACNGCLLSDDLLKELDTLKQLTLDFKLSSEPLRCLGLDVSKEPFNGVPIRRISQETSLRFVYSSIENLNVVIPIYVMGVGGTRICVWNIGDVNDCTDREPLMVMYFPEGIRPTDATATLGIAKDYNSLIGGKFINEPVFYTSDDGGFLRLWSIGNKACQAVIQIDNNALLSVDVNLFYPNMLVIGVETGKIKIYNVWKQCMEYTGQPAEIDFIRMTTIPSYLPNQVYEYLRWYHPVVKVRWIDGTFVLAQYAEPLFSKESTNASTVAIWNLAKDIFDRNDAILCHRTWSQDMSNSWHLASRLLCLYGGHITSLGGVVSSDCKWSNEYGLLAISSDATGQLHVYKPGIWTWADYDDALCLARFKGDMEFHRRIHNKVKQEYGFLMSRQPTDSRDPMASSNLRKNRARLNDFVENAHLQLEHLKEAGTLKNDFGSLPHWIKGTLKLNTEGDKLLKQIHKNLREREIKEHTLTCSAVQR